MNVKLIAFLVAAAAAAVFIPAGFTEVATSPPAEGGVLPPIELGIPENQQYRLSLSHHLLKGRIAQITLFHAGTGHHHPGRFP